MRSIGHPLVARLGGLFVNRTDNSAVESAASVKVTENCRRHPTLSRGRCFRGTRDKGLYGEMVHYSFVTRELNIVTATGEASPPLVHPVLSWFANSGAMGRGFSAFSHTLNSKRLRSG